MTRLLPSCLPHSSFQASQPARRPPLALLRVLVGTPRHAREPLPQGSPRAAGSLAKLIPVVWYGGGQGLVSSWRGSHEVTALPGFYCTVCKHSLCKAGTGVLEGNAGIPITSPGDKPW